MDKEGKVEFNQEGKRRLRAGVTHTEAAGESPCPGSLCHGAHGEVLRNETEKAGGAAS